MDTVYKIALLKTDICCAMETKDPIVKEKIAELIKIISVNEILEFLVERIYYFDHTNNVIKTQNLSLNEALDDYYAFVMDVLSFMNDIEQFNLAFYEKYLEASLLMARRENPIDYYYDAFELIDETILLRVRKDLIMKILYTLMHDKPLNFETINFYKEELKKLIN